MNIQQLKESLPDFAKDVKLNVSSLISMADTGGLESNQVAGIMLACAYALRSQKLIAAAEAQVAEILDEPHFKAAKIAAMLMAMNNIYYRFVHLASEKEFTSVPARLRMNALREHGIATADFELYSLAVSALNGCGMCIDAHVNELKKHGFTVEAIQMSARIAAIMNSMAQALAITES